MKELLERIRGAMVIAVSEGSGFVEVTLAMSMDELTVWVEDVCDATGCIDEHYIPEGL